jgi:transcriptional repressor NrdR
MFARDAPVGTERGRRLASVRTVRCPSCHAADTRVVDSRSADDGSAIRRRRECSTCGRRITTFERYEEVPLLVVKRSGGREPFDRDKIVRGLVSASKGRPLGSEHFIDLSVAVEESARLEGSEVTSEWIGRAVLERLRPLDQVASIRFASVYKDFADVSDFAREAVLLQGATDGLTTA